MSADKKYRLGMFGNPFQTNLDQQPPRVLLSGDFFRDGDDFEALLVAILLHQQGRIRLEGIIVNLHPVEDRACAILGLIQHLNLEVPVAMGSDVFYDEDLDKMRDSLEGDLDIKFPYKADPKDLVDAYALLEGCYKSAAERRKESPGIEGITIVSHAAMDPITNFFESDLSDEMLTCTERIVHMGGKGSHNDAMSSDLMDTDSRYKYLKNPELAEVAAAEVAAAEVAAVEVVGTKAAREAIITMDSLREAAKDSVLMQDLLKRRDKGHRRLWEIVIERENNRDANALPLDRGVLWFADLLCEGKIPGIIEGEGENRTIDLTKKREIDIVAHVTQYASYDLFALLYALPEFAFLFKNPGLGVETPNQIYSIEALNKVMNNLLRASVSFEVEAFSRSVLIVHTF